MNKNIMSTFIQFIDRERELKFLESQTARKAAFVVIYGRRSARKTSCESLGKRPALFHGIKTTGRSTTPFSQKHSKERKKHGRMFFFLTCKL